MMVTRCSSVTNLLSVQIRIFLSGVLQFGRDGFLWLSCNPEDFPSETTPTASVRFLFDNIEIAMLYLCSSNRYHDDEDLKRVMMELKRDSQMEPISKFIDVEFAHYDVLSMEKGNASWGKYWILLLRAGA